MNFFTNLLILILHIIHLVYSDQNCGQQTEFTDSSGVIRSLTPYKRGKSCVYKINLNLFTNYVRMHFETFKIDGDMPDCSKDRLEIWAGCQTLRRIAKFCKNNMIASLPHDIYTKQTCIEVRLYASSEGSSSDNGFSLRYERVGTGSAGISSSCKSDTDLDKGSGVIASPRWPEQFQKNDLPRYYRDCEWDIITDKDNLIQINAMDVDFAGGGGFCSYKNYLKIKGEKSVIKSTSSSSSYCSRRDPFTLNTKYYKVEVELKGYYTPSGTERGFLLGYVTYRDSEAANKAKWGMIIGIVIVIIFVSIAAFCICRKCRARHAQSLPPQPQPINTGYGTGTTTTQVTTTVPLIDKQQPPPPGVYPLPPPGAYPPNPGSYQGYPDAPPPYPGPPMDGSTPYPPPAMAQPYPPHAPAPYPAAPYPPPAAPYPQN